MASYIQPQQDITMGTKGGGGKVSGAFLKRQESHTHTFHFQWMNLREQKVKVVFYTK